jgi:hypothetical protein
MHVAHTVGHIKHSGYEANSVAVEWKVRWPRGAQAVALRLMGNNIKHFGTHGDLVSMIRKPKIHKEGVVRFWACTLDGDVNVGRPV